MTLHVILSTARNLFVALGVRFLAPLEMTATTVQGILLYLSAVGGYLNKKLKGA